MGVVGGCNVDLVVRCAHLPRPGETVLTGDIVRLPGGKGANQAAAAAHLGAIVSLVSSLGSDEAGDWMAGVLEGHGVDTSLTRRSMRPTGTAFITIDEHGENQIVVASGANAELDVSTVDFSVFDVVLAQLEVSTAVVEDVARRARRLVLNVAPARDVASDTLAHCAVVVANELEAERLELASLEHCVVTLGERGAVHYRRGREVARADARKVEPVDTVGAGDVFCAAYALAYAREVSPAAALEFAVGAGSLATLALGAQGALPSEQEVRQWLDNA